MSVIEHLDNNKNKVLGVVFSDGGFTIHLGTSSRIEGYESPSEENLQYIADNKIPLVDMRGVSTRDIINLPLIGESMAEGPITSSSRVPFEVYANMAARVGGRVANIEPINFIPEMFNPNSKSIMMAMASYIDGNERGVGEAIERRQTEIPNDWQVPAGEDLELFSKAREQLAKDLVDNEKESLKLNQMSRSSEASDIERRSAYNKSLALQGASTYTREIMNVITWNALMVKAGNSSVVDAWKGVQDFADTQKANLKDLKDSLSVRTHPHIHECVEKMNGTYKWVSTMTNAAIGIAERDKSSGDELSSPRM